MATEDNGNIGLLKPMSSSNEDLSEYTDADESISAPTEFLAEVKTVQSFSSRVQKSLDSCSENRFLASFIRSWHLTLWSFGAKLGNKVGFRCAILTRNYSVFSCPQRNN